MQGRKFDGRNQAFEPVFKHLAQIGATILDTPAYFLNSHGFYDVVRQGQLLYTDDQHLTVYGAQLLVPMLEPLFERQGVLPGTGPGARSRGTGMD
jgi:lysophospholipase L1-like esterase